MLAKLILWAAIAFIAAIVLDDCCSKFWRAPRAVFVELILWAAIAFIATTVLARGQEAVREPLGAERRGTGIERHAGARPCQSRHEVQADHPSYRIVEGRRCWYASRRTAPADLPTLDVNPHDDPIWQESNAGTPAGKSARTGGIQRTRSETNKDRAVQQEAQNCEEQALKLFGPEEMKVGGPNERSVFLRQCGSR